MLRMIWTTLEVQLEPILQISVKLDTIWKCLNIDLGGKGDFLALINFNQYILVLIVWIWENKPSLWYVETSWNYTLVAYVEQSFL